jgi:citrate synthase
MASEIGSEENAEGYINELRARGKRVMGIGHPVYRAVDPRSVHLKADAKALADRRGQPKWFSILQQVTEVMEPYARKGHHPNVDFWAGAIYHLLGIPEDLFIPLFAIGRMPGFTMHLMEQYGKKDLLRPRLLYSGPMDLDYVPIEQRN